MTNQIKTFMQVTIIDSHIEKSIRNTPYTGGKLHFRLGYATPNNNSVCSCSSYRPTLAFLMGRPAAQLAIVEANLVLFGIVYSNRTNQNSHESGLRAIQKVFRYGA